MKTYLISTPQRCGSTWLSRMLCATTGTQEVYVDGIQKGFRLAKVSEAGAVEKMAAAIARHPATQVFKTHDVAPRDFAALCAAVPGLRVLTVSRDLRDSVVSRYFYFRYYWPLRYAVETRPPRFQQFLEKIGDAPDGEALRVLLDEEFAEGWAREWAAFEAPFTTELALRVRYAGMLDGSEFETISAFIELPLKKAQSFKDQQSSETKMTGREGKERFNRSGREGEWREWWSEAEGERLLGMGQRWLERISRL